VKATKPFFLIAAVALLLSVLSSGCAQRDCHGKKMIRLNNGVRI